MRFSREIYEYDLPHRAVTVFMYLSNRDNLSAKAKAEKYAKITAKTIINIGGESSSFGQNAFFYTMHVETDSTSFTRVIINGSGEIINTETTFEFNDFYYTLVDDRPIYFGVIPSSDPSQPPTIAILHVSTEFSWLKEFFEVSLTIQNNASSEFSIYDSNASITLPAGLSLAKTNTDNSASRNMGIVYGGQSKTVSWIVRGDTAGKYNVRADFAGILSPFNESVFASFKTINPIVVNGGDALELKVKNKLWDPDNSLWTVDFTLTNVSQSTIYNPKINYSGYAEFVTVNNMVLEYPNGIKEVIPWENGNPVKSKKALFLPALLKEGFSEEIVLKPGECITGRYSARKQGD